MGMAGSSPLGSELTKMQKVDQESRITIWVLLIYFHGTFSLFFKAVLTFDNKHTLLDITSECQLYHGYELFGDKKTKWCDFVLFFNNCNWLIGSPLGHSRKPKREFRHTNTNYVNQCPPATLWTVTVLSTSVLVWF